MNLSPAQIKKIVAEIKHDPHYKVLGESRIIVNSHLMEHLLAQDESIAMRITSMDLFQMRADITDAMYV